MRVQIRRQIRALRPGDIIDVGDGVAELWIRYGWADRLVPPTPIEVTITEPSAPKRSKAGGRRLAHS